MSLLLEALKKAERTKEDQAQPPHPAGTGSALSLLDEAASPGSKASPSAPAASDQANAKAESERKAAEQLFSAKQGPGARRLIPIAVVVALALAAGGGYYVWTELQPKGGLRVATGPRPAPPPAPAQPAPAPQAAGPVTAPSTPSPETGAVPPRAAETPTGGEPKARAETPRQRERAPAARETTARAGSERIRIERSRAASQLDPNLAAGYQALTQGDLDTAQNNYSRALRSDPNNRDALLGLAAAAQKRGDAAEAQRLYRRVLEIDPKEPNANAAMVTLRPQADGGQDESRIRTLIAEHPESAVLSFTLGNLYANQSRWAEAQQAYFRAFSQEPTSADYAFNLAVSLDQLARRKLAADYYRRALSLASAGQSNFDRAQATQRVQELEQAR